jgi:hypothetical protein
MRVARCAPEISVALTSAWLETVAACAAGARITSSIAARAMVLRMLVFALSLDAGGTRPVGR